MMFYKIFCCILFLSYLCFSNANIINTNVDRTVDISTQLVKQTLKITAEDDQPIKKYTLVFPDTVYNKLAFISAKDGSKRDIKTKENNANGKKEIICEFESSSKIQNLYIDIVFSKAISPYPEEISQSEKQTVKYDGQLYFYSPYKTKSQKLIVTLSGSEILSHTQVKPFSVQSNKISYGPYENIEEYTDQALKIHYENQTPFLTVNSLERSIEVSHWGNIAVKEDICLTHSGAKLKGSFSRYEFQKDARSGQAAVKSYKSILPASAGDVYYRDSNGNISTSNMNILRDSVELELRPRFPLFGGWKTRYTLGYNVPSFEYLYKESDKFLLKMRVVDHIYDNMIIDEAQIKIILPEGSSNIELITPYKVKRNVDGVLYTYLDTVGRPVIEFSKTNLVENHILDFHLQYTYSSLCLLQEPLLVISFIFIIFFIAIISMRLDFSINHSHKE